MAEQQRKQRAMWLLGFTLEGHDIELVPIEDGSTGRVDVDQDRWLTLSPINSDFAVMEYDHGEERDLGVMSLQSCVLWTRAVLRSLEQPPALEL